VAYTGASTAYHPQTDGQTEQVNQELEQYIRLFVNECQDNWNSLIPLAEFAYNNHVHLSTQQTPFFLDTSHHPRMGSEPHQPRSRVEAVNEFADRMKATLEEAKSVLNKSKDDMARYYNRRWTPALVFSPGDKVFLDAGDIHITQPSKKLSHRHLGPYPVVCRVGSNAYCLLLPPSMSRLHPVFNVIKLTLAPTDPITGRHAPPLPPPELIDGEEEYVVEEILNSRMFRRKLQYLVKWEGYGVENNTWEYWDNLGNAADAVNDFHTRNPAAPCRIHALTFGSIPFRPIPPVTIASGRCNSEGGVIVRGTPNPPTDPCQPAEPTHRLSCLDAHQHPCTAPPSPPTSHHCHPSLIPVNWLTTPTPTGANRSTITTGLYVPPHLWTLRPWGPFYLSFHFYFLFLYCVILHTIVSPLYMASLARDPYPFLFGSPARCVDYIVYYCIIH